jgi:hypothetical protein
MTPPHPVAVAAAAPVHKPADDKVVWGGYLRARKMVESRLRKAPRTAESKGFFYLRGDKFWRRLSRMESLMSGRTLRGAELIFNAHDIDRVEMSFTSTRQTQDDVLTYRRASNATEASHAWDENASEWTSDAVTVGGNEEALLHALEEGSAGVVDGKMLVFLSMKSPTPGQVVEFRTNSARELICLRDELNDFLMVKIRQSTTSSSSFSTAFGSPSAGGGSLTVHTGLRGFSERSSSERTSSSSTAPTAPPRVRVPATGSYVEIRKASFRKSKQRKPHSSKSSTRSTLNERKFSL